MSAFSEVKDIQLTDKGHIVTALQELGYTVEEHDLPQTLRDYRGHSTGTKAEIIVRKGQLGGYVNDLGVRKGADGKWTIIASEENAHHLVPRIKQAYTYAKVSKQAKKAGYKVKLKGQKAKTKPQYGKPLELQLVRWG